VPMKGRTRLRASLQELGYHYFEETNNPVYKLFLR
jgi:hypothetical protein